MANSFFARLETSACIVDFEAVLPDGHRYRCSESGSPNFRLERVHGGYFLEARMGTHVGSLMVEVEDDSGRSWSIGPLRPRESDRGFTLR